jgi:hypothetical protein
MAFLRDGESVFSFLNIELTIRFLTLSAGLDYL